MSPQQSVTYTVTGVTQETQFALDGQLIPGKNIRFTTSAGYSGKLFVPDSVFRDPAALKMAIEGDVKAVAAALGITGSVSG